MQQNHWQLEMYAQEMQQRRMQEAEMARQVLAVESSRGTIPGRGVFARIARSLVSVSRGAWTRPATAEETAASATRSTALAVAASSPDIPPVMAPRRLPRQTDPYAAMPVVATGDAFLTAAEPCRVREC